MLRKNTSDGFLLYARPFATSLELPSAPTVLLAPCSRHSCQLILYIRWLLCISISDASTCASGYAATLIGICCGLPTHTQQAIPEVYQP